MTEYGKTDATGIVIENGKVSYTFEENGFLSAMSLKGDGGRTVCFGGGYSSAFRILAGEENGGFEREIGVYADTAVTPVISPFSYENGSGAVISFGDLPDRDGRSTGIAVVQRFMLDDNAELLRAVTEIDNGGGLYISELHLGFEAVALPTPVGEQKFTAPCASLGETIPRAELEGRNLLYTVPQSIPDSLCCTWVDLSSPDMGVSIGYLDRSGMDMLCEAVAKNGDGSMRMNFRLFRYVGGFTFMHDITGPEQIYSLCPGERFVTDEWFFGIHSGDWHGTARFYRSEYEKEFGEDFLNWDRLSQKVKDADVVISDSCAWAGKKNEKGIYTDYDVNGELRHTFDEAASRLADSIKILGADPGNVLYVVLGTGTHWGIYKLPDYFPACAEAGGDEGFARMIRRVKDDIGVAGAYFYAHTSFNHREAVNYAANADTGYCPRLCADYSHLGTIACTDEDSWQELWKNTIIPSFVSRGADGIEFDEGFGHHFVCLNKEHRHGGSAEGILKAQTNGMLKIVRECRRQFGKDCFFETEGTSDVAARLTDLWEASGIDEAEAARYTHPDRLVTVFANTDRDVHNAFVYGCPVLVSADKALGDTDKTITENFISIRAAMRKEKPFGYPFGFMDEDGLSVGDGVKAKIYADGEGVTVAYAAADRADTEIAVDMSLYTDKRETVRVRIGAGAGEMGYVKIPFGEDGYTHRFVRG